MKSEALYTFSYKNNINIHYCFILIYILIYISSCAYMVQTAIWNCGMPIRIWRWDTKIASRTNKPDSMLYRHFRLFNLLNIASPTIHTHLEISPLFNSIYNHLELQSSERTYYCNISDTVQNNLSTILIINTLNTIIWVSTW